MTTCVVDAADAPPITLRVLGISVTFHTSSAAVRRLAGECFHSLGAAMEPASAGTLELTVRIMVCDGNEHGIFPVPVRHISMDGGMLLVHTPGSTALVHPAHRSSTAYVSRELLAHEDTFRTAVLEAITYALIAPFDRHPVHASAIVRNGCAVLLAGPSGSGKSTLAHRADAAGVDVLSEDHVWIQCEPALRVWGGAEAARLMLDDADDEKQTVPITHRAVWAERARVCVLARGEHALLEPLDPAAIIRELEAQVAPGFDRFPERQQQVFAAIAASGGWRLTLSSRPADALPFLFEMLEST
ncbi:MAG: hypothetical protein JWM95_4406 [Gemmatimonadetes bacterium]|nr:hypothetical protein [Gemmatimonadota bacterium]